jgi:hypothetical protein
MTNSDELTTADLCRMARRFLTEARICAEPDPNRLSADPASSNERIPVLGFAAMSLALTCMTALGEALLTIRKTAPTAKLASQGPSDRECIDAFVEYAKPSDFGIIGLSKLKGVSTGHLLWSLRNSLAHALSMPNDLRLENSREDLLSSWPGAYIIPSEFVSQVSATVATLSKEHGHIQFQDHPSRGALPRSIATVGTRQEGTYHITAGSTPGVSPYPPPENHWPKT